MQVTKRAGHALNRAGKVRFQVWIAGAKFTIASARQALERKAGFDPNQPRDGQGRWTDATSGGGGGIGIGSELGDIGDVDLGIDDIGLGDVDLGDLGDIDLGDFDLGDVDGDITRTIETDESGEAAWSTIVSDRRRDGSPAQEMVFNRDGSTIHSEYARAGDSLGWDERHTVVTTGGDRIRFERSGDTVTITDADTGEVLGRSTWGQDGPEPEATLQPAFVGPAAPATIEAAAALYVWLSGRNTAERTGILSFRAIEVKPGETPEAKPEWLGFRTRDEVNEACPRHEEVQSRTDDAADRVRREGNYWTPQQYGTRVHSDLKKQIDGLSDPHFRAEVSLSKVVAETRIADSYGARNSIRIDVLENVGNGTVCVYDIKTGRSGLSAARMAEIVGTVFRRYPYVKRILMIETRPRR